MVRWLAPIAMLAACGFRPTAATSGDDGGLHDGATIDVADGMHVDPFQDAAIGCYGTGLGVHVCLKAPPTTALDVPALKAIDTTLGSTDCVDLVGPTADDYCVVSATAITIEGFLSATGPRPLVLLSLSTLDNNGTIDVASHSSPVTVGAGGDSTSCGGTAASASRSAGFGGSFGTKGGDGGSTTPPDGKAGPAIVPTSLRGGCAGGSGLDATATGIGGHGGGAVDLIAVTAITVFGEIDASGSAGGGAGPTNNGAGGGGSGGLIVLDSPAVSFDGTTVIFANGGGGGGGSDNIGMASGSDGGDPLGYNSGGGGGAGAISAGGNTGGLGGDGARFSADSTDGADGTTGGGNGGGGGGGGLLRVFQSPLPVGGHESPAPTA